MTDAVRQAAMYDPKTKKLSYIDLCFHAHHLNFAEDANNTLWFNDLGIGQRLPWRNHQADARCESIRDIAGRAL